jgi:hypothetical protein
MLVADGGDAEAFGAARCGHDGQSATAAKACQAMVRKPCATVDRHTDPELDVHLAATGREVRI